MKEKELSFGKNQVQNGCCGVISVNIHELVSKNMSALSKKGKNTSQTGKQFRKYFYCYCLAEALLAEAEVQCKTRFIIQNVSFAQDLVYD